MDNFFLFFDADDKAVLIQNDPKALDAAPYDRVVRRHSTKPVDAGLADLALKMHGGIAVYSDRTVEVKPA